MAIQKILPVQDPILRKNSKSIRTGDKKLKKLITDLADTLVAQKNPVGVGLAAPQIGKPQKVFIVKSGKKVIPFINPEIISKSKTTNDPPQASSENPKTTTSSKEVSEPEHHHEYVMEGCLSLPHYYGPVQRSARIKVKYQTAQEPNNLITKTQSFVGLPAQIIQHEVDHLNGALFVDRLLEQERKLFRIEDGEWKEVELV